MNFLWWLSVFVLSGLMGMLFVLYLSAHPLRMSYYLIASFVTFGILLVVLRLKFEQISLVFAILLSLGMFIVGHLSMTKIILIRDDPRPVPELTRQPGDTGSGSYSCDLFHTRRTRNLQSHWLDQPIQRI